MSFISFIDKTFIHHKLHSEIEQIGKARILVYTLLLCSLMTVLYVFYFEIFHGNESTIRRLANIVALFSASVSLFIVKKYGNIYIAMLYIIFLAFGLVITSAYYTGGIYSVDMFWFSIITINTFFLLNKKSGIIVFIFSLSIITLFYINHYLGLFGFELSKNKTILFYDYYSLLFQLCFATFSIQFFLSGYNKIKKQLEEKAKIEAELRINRARINPHFFFNILSSLQSFAFEKENQDKVPLHLAKYASIMRKTLESTYQELTSLTQEIDFLTKYLELQQLRFSSKFVFHFHIHEDIDLDAVKIPSMLLQPFLENSIEHGFKNIDYLGEINIRFEVESNQLLCIEIADNGSSIKNLQIPKIYPSRAIQIVKDRIFLLNYGNPSKNTFFQITNNEEAEGYIINMKIPLYETLI